MCSHRVITFDARGSGRSDRPLDPAAYDPRELIGDALAVLDAAGAERAVVVGNSFGGLLAYLLAALHPERTLGAVLIGATINVEGDAQSPFVRAQETFELDYVDDAGWLRYNAHSLRRDYAGFVRFFIEQALGEEAQPEHVAEGLAFGRDTTPEVLAASVRARARTSPREQAQLLQALAARIRCPLLVIQGDRDRVVPVEWGRAVARRTGAELEILRGAGHVPQVTRAAEVNASIARFAARFGHASREACA